MKETRNSVFAFTSYALIGWLGRKPPYQPGLAFSSAGGFVGHFGEVVVEGCDEASDAEEDGIGIENFVASWEFGLVLVPNEFSVVVDVLLEHLSVGEKSGQSSAVEILEIPFGADETLLELRFCFCEISNHFGTEGFDGFVPCEGFPVRSSESGLVALGDHVVEGAIESAILAELSSQQVQHGHFRLSVGGKFAEDRESEKSVQRELATDLTNGNACRSGMLRHRHNIRVGACQNAILRNVPEKVDRYHLVIVVVELDGEITFRLCGEGQCQGEVSFEGFIVDVEIECGFILTVQPALPGPVVDDGPITLGDATNPFRPVVRQGGIIV